VRIKIVVAGGLALTVIAVLLVLLHAPATVIATNGIPATSALGATKQDVDVCQADETLPAGTSAIRLAVEATTGPRVSVEVLEGARVIARGAAGTAWFGSVVTLPVGPLRRTVSHTRVCFQLSQLSGYVQVVGARTSPAVAGTVNGANMGGRVRIAYLGPSGHSWWSLGGAVIEHMGLGRAASGTWIVLPIVLLAAGAFALASWLVIRELG
jgi:hypothetical protein